MECRCSLLYLNKGLRHLNLPEHVLLLSDRQATIFLHQHVGRCHVLPHEGYEVDPYKDGHDHLAIHSVGETPVTCACTCACMRIRVHVRACEYVYMCVHAYMIAWVGGCVWVRVCVRAWICEGAH